MVSLPVRVASRRCFLPTPNLTAIPAGPVSGNLSNRRWRRVRIERWAWSAKRCIAAAAAGIWGTYLMMARNPPVCATA
ncbi:hypothetical protein D3C72_2023920 [compost metagenome]